VQARCQTISSACASGIEALAYGADLIREGSADVVIAGGADATITPLAVASFITAGMLPDTDGDPALASCPFDKNRRGGVIGEGAGILILENLEHALIRGAKPLAELVGHGSMIDRPGSLPGSGMFNAMQLALENSGRYAHEVEYINAHGPSDPVLDVMESRSIKQVLGERAYRVPVSSIKGATGNPLAAAGPLQVCACVLAMTHHLLPPTANYREPDPECDLDYVPNTPRPYPLKRALVNGHGMGGINSSLLLESMNGV
ncbi:MAG: beta-ketoacyl-[acyl-carrier-protein] synthase family protein, partial [Verrucomicrobia bacterium]|nr:beta-ketoacyl-[acyl-carrier-protein] synthase family protein [Verrucomicrobiota bacterium]